MVGAAPVCPPERPRSGVSIRKGHVPQPQRRRFYALKCFYITHDAHLLTMDAPLQGDTGGHTGTAPTISRVAPCPKVADEGLSAAQKEFIVAARGFPLHKKEFIVAARGSPLHKNEFIVAARGFPLH